MDALRVATVSSVIALLGVTSTATAALHPRTLTLRIAANAGELVFSGELSDDVAIGPSECVSGAPVTIQRASGPNWVDVTTTNTGPSDPQGSTTYSATAARVDGTYRAHVPAAGECGEATSPTLKAAAPKPPAPHRCTVSAHDGPGGLAEFDITCAHAIKNGEIDFMINRGGCDRGCDPRITRPKGSDMFCGGRARGTPSHPAETLGCEGSLPAGKRLILRQRFGRLAPCASPAVRGTFKVRFGDGTTIGPRRLPAYRCSAHTYRRHFSLFAIGAEPGGGYGWVATLQPDSSTFLQCVKHVPILIQTRRGSGWKTLLRLRSSRQTNNTNASQMQGQMPGGTGGPGMYRIVAPRIRFGRQTCAAATRTFRQVH